MSGRSSVLTECQRIIDVLGDKSARWDERDDAGMDLADADEPEALDALMRVGRDAGEDETLRPLATADPHLLDLCADVDIPITVLPDSTGQLWSQKVPSSR